MILSWSRGPKLVAEVADNESIVTTPGSSLNPFPRWLVL